MIKSKRKFVIKMWDKVIGKEEQLILQTFSPSRIGVFDNAVDIDSCLNKKNIKQIYAVLNRVSSDALKSLPVNTLKQIEKGEGISKADIDKLRFFFIDIDIVGLSKVGGKKQNATEEQHEKAHELALEVKKYLTTLGFPLPVIIDSANGYHLLYKLDLPATDDNEKLIKRSTCSLAEIMDTDECKIDTVVADRARKIKMPGSANQLDQQNARYSSIVELPDELKIVTKDQLMHLASLKKSKSKGWTNSAGDKENPDKDMIDLVEEIGDYFVSDTKQTYANVRVDNGTVITMNVMSNEFRLAVRKAMKNVLKVKTLSNDMWKSILDYLEVIASENVTDVKIYNRIGKRDDKYYYDLQTDDYKCVEITEEEWDIIDTPPGIFQRVDLDKPQCEPIFDETFDYLGALSELFNLRSRQEIELLGIWLISCYIPDISKPLVLFSGSHATGKSTACSMLQDLISPQTMQRSAFPRRIDDLVVRLANRCMCFWDNCERISIEASNILCQCITGGNYEKRKLYTDTSLVSIPLKSMILMNSCESILERPDILSRTLQFNLQPINGDDMRDDESMWKLYEEKKPYLLGEIFAYIAAVMSIPNPDNMHYVIRMTEFQKIASKITQVVLGADSNYIEELLLNNKHQIDLQQLESNPVAVLIINFMKNRSRWEGSVTELYDKLDALAFDMGIEKGNKLYPRHAASLSMRLNSLVGMLENVGITFSIRPEGAYKKIYIKNTNFSGSKAHRHSSQYRKEKIR